jgi:integrase/quercetin dioxygenase-like cupin family protein
MPEKTDPGNPHATAAENARFAAFAAALEREGFSSSTRACYASDWWTTSQFAQRASGRRFRLDRFRAEDFLLQRAELSAQGAAPSTLNRRLAFLRRYSAFAAERDASFADVAAEFAAVPYQSVPRWSTKPLTRAEEERLRRAADARGVQEAAIVALLLGTGLRASEAASLVRGDVVGPAAAPTALRVGGPRAKTVMLAPRAQERLGAHLAASRGGRADPVFHGRGDAPMGEDGIVAAVEQVSRDAGVEATPRTLRHSFAVRYLCEHRDDLDGLARALGQKSLTAARAYREQAESVEPAARALAWGELDETEPQPGVRRRTFAGARLGADRELLAPGVRIAPHAHAEEQVTFVLSGRVAVHVGASRFEAGAGGLVHVPSGVSHGIAAVRDRPALLLHVYSPPPRD